MSSRNRHHKLVGVGCACRREVVAARRPYLKSPRVPDTCGGARGGVASTSSISCPSSRTNRIPALSQSATLANAGNRCRLVSGVSNVHLVKHSHARESTGLKLPTHLHVYSAQSHPSVVAANSLDRPQEQPHAGKGAKHGAWRPTPGATWLPSYSQRAPVDLVFACRSTRPLASFVVVQMIRTSSA